MAGRLLTCCCRGLFRVNDDSRELYTTLGVEKDADDGQIRTAYRKNCLRLHPDKLAQQGLVVTEEDRAKFQRMKHAYDVLSNPEKRQVYDEMGDTGLKLMEDPGAAFNPDVLMHNFLTMRTRDRLVLVLFVVGIVAAIMLFPILLCIKADGDTNAKWAAIWTPLWIYDAIFLLLYAHNVARGRKPPEGASPEEEEASAAEAAAWPLWERCVDLLQWSLVVLFQIFLTLKLDDNVGWSWAVVFSPVFVWYGVRCLKNLAQICAKLPRAPEIPASGTPGDEEDEGAAAMAFEEQRARHADAVLKKAAALNVLLKDMFWIVQASFVVARLDDSVDWSWWAVFSPVWLAFAGFAALNLLTYHSASVIAANANVAPGQDPATYTEEQTLKMSVAGDLVGRFYSSCCTWILGFCVTVVAVARIAGADYSVFYVFMPLYVIAGLLLCCMVCFICCARDVDDGEEAEHAGGQGPVADPERPSYGTYSPPAPATDGKAPGPTAAADSLEEGKVGGGGGGVPAEELRLAGPPRPPSLRGNEGPASAPLPPGTGIGIGGVSVDLD